MAGSPRTPPRFVPTLTVVVEEPPAPAASAPAEAPPAVSSVDRPAQPVAQVALSPLAEADANANANANANAFRFEDELLHRVLQRIDLSLEERLTDTVSAAVQQQLDLMLPQLRAEIEQVLRALVVEALAQELSQDPRSASTPGPLTFG